MHASRQIKRMSPLKMDGKEKDLLQDLAIKKAISWKNNYIVLLEKINLTLYPCRAWALFLQEVGGKRDEKYVFSIGRIYGSKALEIIKKRINELKFNLPEHYQTFPAFVEISGVGKIKTLEEDKEVRIIFNNHATLNHSLERYKEKAMAPSFYAGILTEFYNSFFMKKIVFKPLVENGEVVFTAKK